MSSEPQVSTLADLVDYQDDSTASKAIIKRETGTVTLFALDEGQELSEHTAPFDALVFVLDGEVEITISGSPYVLKEGEMIVVPINRPHSLKAIKKFKMMLTKIRP